MLALATIHQKYGKLLLTIVSIARGADMHADLRVRRKLCIVAYNEYLTADRAWAVALTEASAFVPDSVGHSYWRLGDRGSRIRGLYDQRDQALQKLEVAHKKLTDAKSRLSLRSQKAQNPLPLEPAT